MCETCLHNFRVFAVTSAYENEISGFLTNVLFKWSMLVQQSFDNKCNNFWKLLNNKVIMWTCECSRAFSISVKSSSSFVPSAPPTFSLTLCKTNKPKKKKRIIRPANHEKVKCCKCKRSKKFLWFSVMTLNNWIWTIWKKPWAKYRHR